MKITNKYENNGELFYTVELEEDVFLDVKYTGDLCYIMDCEDGYTTYDSNGNTFGFYFDATEVLSFVLNYIQEEITSSMKKYNVRLNFFWDDGDDMQTFVVMVPDGVTVAEVEEALLKTHNFLCNEDEEDTYGLDGRNPETLINYVCKERGWKWENPQFDIDLNFD